MSQTQPKGGVCRLCALMALLPQTARADSGQLVSLPWQTALLVLLFAVFFLRRIVEWTTVPADLERQRVRGFVFALCFALLVSPIVGGLIETGALPRFNDVFLVGVVLTSYLFTWEGAAFLLVLATLVSAWVLPPYGTFAITQPEDWYRLVSFVAISTFLIALVHRLKARSKGQLLDNGMARGMAIGD